ncbi:MAG: MotA/TolQ/ExbB proton channel family protein, partial [Cyclobacteriaceae bacterium]
MLILQIQTELDTTALETGTEVVSVWDLLLKGGYVMVPLILLLFLAIYIFVERVLTIKQASKVPEQFTDKIRSLVAGGDINGARLICSQTNTPIARMIEKGITRIGSPLKTIEAAIENVGKIELYRLEKNLNLLA